MSTYFTEDHEWVKVEGDIATIGITNHAQEQLGEVVFVELKDAGDEVEKEDEIGVIESVKAASEIYAPVAGEIVEANESVVETPTAINDDAEGAAWLYKIKIADASELEGLLDADAYKALID